MSETGQADAKYRAPALDKGLDILEFLSGQPNGLTRAEIVKAIGRSHGEIYRMLERLVARDYVSRSFEGDRYALTMKLFVLGSQHPPVRRLVARAQPLMDIFAEKTEQSVHLVMPEGGWGIVTAQASCPSNWEFRLRIGARLDLLRTSSGQTLLAFQSAERRLETLSVGIGGERGKALAGIEARLEAIRAQGYRLGDSLQIVGVQDISVPVLGPSGEALGVLTCPYLMHVEKDSLDREATLAELQGVAQAVSIA